MFEAPMKFSRILLMTWDYRENGMPINMVSSTNLLCETGVSESCKHIPCIRPIETVTLVLSLRPSTITIKIKGDRGSPYQIPHKGLKGMEGEPFIKIEKKVEKISERVQLN